MIYGGFEYFAPIIFKSQIGKIINFDNLPSPPCVLAVNHVSPYDPILIVLMLYDWIKKYNKKLVFLTNPKVIPLFGPFYKTLGGFKGTKQGLKDAFRFIEKGMPICIFANRDRRAKIMKRFHLGPAYIASIAKVPLVPMGLISKHEVFPSNDVFQMIKNFFYKKNLIIGEPFYLQKEISLLKTTELLTQKVAAMIGKTIVPTNK
ncbi:MAG: lysophospholipid acyltransferase family protein [candidate division WOR-3 bacterium]